MDTSLKGLCSISNNVAGGTQRQKQTEPYRILGLLAKFGSLQGGHRVQCSNDRNDDIVLSVVTAAEDLEDAAIQGELLNSTFSYIASEKNHDDLR